MNTSPATPDTSPMGESRAFRHTPGPWVASQAIRGQDCGSHIHTAANPHGIPLAHVYSRASGEANAALIAAAPDLLAALQGCVDALSPPRNSDEREALETARAAITKATTPAS